MFSKKWITDKGNFTVHYFYNSVTNYKMLNPEKSYTDIFNIIRDEIKQSLEEKLAELYSLDNNLNIVSKDVLNSCFYDNKLEDYGWYKIEHNTNPFNKEDKVIIVVRLYRYLVDLNGGDEYMYLFGTKSK